MIGGGAALGMMGAAGPLKRDDPFYADCVSIIDLPEFCDEYKGVESNKPIVAAGLGIAAAGALLMLLGRGRVSRNISVVAVPKGFAINHVIRFDGRSHVRGN